MGKDHPRRLISDAAWNQLEKALEGAKHSRAGAPAELGDRDFLEAVLYLVRVGCPWRDLPAELGYWHAVYMRFRRWEERRVWSKLWQQLQAPRLAQARHLFIDSTTVRAHHHAAGALKKTVSIRLWAALAEG
jgi:transposase